MIWKISYRTRISLCLEKIKSKLYYDEYMVKRSFEAAKLIKNFVEKTVKKYA